MIQTGIEAANQARKLESPIVGLDQLPETRSIHVSNRNSHDGPQLA